MRTKKISGREKLIRYIKENDIFYLSASFEGHSNEQLEKIRARVESSMLKTQKEKKVKKFSGKE